MLGEEIQMDIQAASYDHNEMVGLLTRAGYKHVELWHTGGGIMNPVIGLEYAGDTSTAIRYVMFSMDWCPAEASFGIYNETDDCAEEPIAEWYGAGDDVPMSPRDIVRLVDEKIVEASCKNPTVLQLPERCGGEMLVAEAVCWTEGTHWLVYLPIEEGCAMRPLSVWKAEGLRWRYVPAGAVPDELIATATFGVLGYS